MFAGRFALERWSGGAPGGRKHAVLRSTGPPSSRSHPAGGTAGSARTRSRVQTLEDPFLGSGVCFPRLPSQKPPQADGPCSWAVRRVCALPPEQKRNEASPPPARGAWVRVHAAEGYWLPALPAPRDLRLPVSPTAAGGKSLLVDLPPSARTSAPSETKRSTQAPCSWGLGACTCRRRHWPAALPAHLPTQKLAKMASMTASEASRPVTLSRRAQALRMSGATTSGLNPS